MSEQKTADETIYLMVVLRFQPDLIGSFSSIGIRKTMAILHRTEGEMKKSKYRFMGFFIPILASLEAEFRMTLYQRQHYHQWENY